MRLVMTRRILRMRTLLSVLALAFAAACGTDDGPSLDDLMRKNASLIEPKLVNLEKIARAPLPETTGEIELSGPMIVWTHKSGAVAGGNATLAFDVDLKDLTTKGRTELRTSNIDIANDCYSTVRKKQIASEDSPRGFRGGWANELVMKDMLLQCPALRYLVVARIDDYKATEYIDEEKFGAGRAAASALLFDLDTGTYLGGVRLTAASSASAHDPASDLAVNFYRALDSALNAAIPGASLPYLPSIAPSK
jgi:hypothetical protein